MAQSFSMRDLRNSTSRVVDAARRDGLATITLHGKPVLNVTPVVDAADDWSSYIDAVIAELPPARDTGLAAELAELDDASPLSF